MFIFQNYAMKFNKETQYSFNDVFIIQWISDIKSRKECSINPTLSWIKKPLNATTPYLAANMNAVSGKRMAESIATYGWLCCLPQDMSFSRKKNIIEQLHDTYPNLLTPIWIEDWKENVIVVKQLAQKKSINAVFLKNEQGAIVGYYTKEYLNNFPESEKVISTNIPPLPVEVMKDHFFEENVEEYYNKMVEEKKDFLVFVKHWENCKYGILTKKHAIRLWEYSPTLNKKWKLDVIITYWMNQILSDDTTLEEIILFYNEYWITNFLIDTAHGGQLWMVKAIEKVRTYLSQNLDEKSRNEIVIIAWNVCTAETTRLLLDAWADWVKVWIWPWAMCSTRMQTWVWRPQFSAILSCAEEARKTNNWVIADGWIKHTRDVCLALAAGASYVMLWTVLAWTLESVSEVKQDINWRAYKENFGMASLFAVKERNKDYSPFQIAKKMRYQEWISSSYIYLQEGLSTVWEVIDHFTTWLQSSMTYVWARNLKEFYDKVEVWVQTPSWYTEGTPHGKVVG